MGKQYEIIDGDLAAWIHRQKVFFVATAPLAEDGHLNCSPKGSDSFRILGEKLVAYADLTGSGVETIAHVQENGRIVLMFCAFEGPPKIVRLHGRAEILYPGTKAYDDLCSHFPDNPGRRSIVLVTVSRISDSCGFAVPLYTFTGERDTLDRWAAGKTPGELAAYRSAKNHHSLDGLPGYLGPREPER